MIATQESEELVDPQEIAVMQISEKEAVRLIREWSGRRWLVPGRWWKWPTAISLAMASSLEISVTVPSTLDGASKFLIQSFAVLLLLVPVTCPCDDMYCFVFHRFQSASQCLTNFAPCFFNCNTSGSMMPPRRGKEPSNSTMAEQRRWESLALWLTSTLETLTISPSLEATENSSNYPTQWRPSNLQFLVSINALVYP